MKQPGVLALVAVMALAPPLAATPPDKAHAATPADKARAQQLLNDGLAALDKQDYATACANFRESDALVATPQAKLNAGLCEETRGDLPSALALYEAAHRGLSDGDERLPELEEKIKTLRERVAAGLAEDEAPAPAPPADEKRGTAAPPPKPAEATDHTLTYVAFGAGVALVATAGLIAADLGGRCGDGRCPSDVDPGNYKTERGVGAAALFVGAASLLGGVVLILGQSSGTAVGGTVSLRGAGAFVTRTF